MLVAAALLCLSAGADPSVCDEDNATESCTASFDPTRSALRALLKHPRDVPPVGTFVHVHVDDLYDAANEPYLAGRRPFVLTGAMESWTAPKKWRNGRVLSKWFGKEIVDFYPMNMLRNGGGNNPYLFEFAPALHELKKKVGHGRFGRKEYDEAWENGNKPGKYLHLQLKEAQWAKLRKNGLGGREKKLHIWLRTDGWMKRCLRTEALRDEYHIKTHWKIILIGSPGAGMFNHSDSLLTSSWHAHIQGRKWWYVCGTGDGDGPYEGTHMCFEDALEVGEILYYPKNYHHETQNLKMPTMTVTGTVVNAHNYMDIADMLHQECHSEILNFQLSGPLCDALDKCYVLWHKGLSGDADKERASRFAKRRWRPWRNLAKPGIEKKKDDPDALGNNYDGRNHISRWNW